MKLQMLSACFGRLQQERLTLGPGLNLIQAPNEGGKSTWCAFLRAMLYGINTRERDKQNYLAEKNRYHPWSGLPMEGEMTLEWQGRTLVVRRFSKGSVPFGGFSVTDGATGEPVAGLGPDTLGEQLTGVGRETYERTAFVGQGGISLTHSGELERRIAALVSSGEEEVSRSQVERRLKEWQNRRQHNKTGLIPRLEGELAGLEEQLERLEQTHLRAEAVRLSLEELDREKSRLELELDAWRLLRQQERYRQYRQAMERLEEERRQVAALEGQSLPPQAELRKCQDDLAYLRTLDDQCKQGERELAQIQAQAQQAQERAQDPCFPQMGPDQAWQQASREAAQAGQAPNLLPQKLLALLGALLAVACGAAAWWSSLLPLWAGVPAGLLLALAGLLLARQTRQKQELQRQAILARYGADSPQEILARAAGYRERWAAAAQAQAQAQTVEESLTQLKLRREGLQVSLLAFVHTFAPEAAGLFGVSAALSRALSLGEQLSTARARLEGALKLVDSLTREGAPQPVDEAAAQPPAQSREELQIRLTQVEGERARLQQELAMEAGELAALGDPAALAARRAQIAEELTRRQGEYQSLALAISALDSADNQLRSRFSPELNRRAGEIFSSLTGGKYGQVSLTREFEALARQPDELLPRRAIALSQGTADQLYLAVRLAICQLVLPPEQGIPLVLDDALAAFDDTRMGLALDYLLQLANQRQVLLFTCHSREGRYLAGRPEVTVLDLH
jgi:uncharacterized protein YhaN